MLRLRPGGEVDRRIAVFSSLLVAATASRNEQKRIGTGFRVRVQVRFDLSTDVRRDHDGSRLTTLGRVNRASAGSMVDRTRDHHRFATRPKVFTAKFGYLAPVMSCCKSCRGHGTQSRCTAHQSGGGRAEHHRAGVVRGRISPKFERGRHTAVRGLPWSIYR